MGSLGYVMQVPEEEKYLMSQDEILTRIVTLYGGRAAEKLVFNSITTGASNDIEKATELARAMVTQYGMSEKFGLMGLESVENRYLDGRTVLNCGEQTSSEIDKEVMEILKRCYARAEELLAGNREVLDKIADHLINKETITGEEFMRIYNEIKNSGEVADADINLSDNNLLESKADIGAIDNSSEANNSTADTLDNNY
jgi:cell division protease FtsH